MAKQRETWKHWRFQNNFNQPRTGRQRSHSTRPAGQKNTCKPFLSIFSLFSSLLCSDYNGYILTEYGNLKIFLFLKIFFHFHLFQLFTGRKKTGESRTIHHFQYVEWPDHGLPISTAKFREMLHKVDEINKDSVPIVVHCRLISLLSSNSPNNF